MCENPNEFKTRALHTDNKNMGKLMLLNSRQSDLQVKHYIPKNKVTFYKTVNYFDSLKTNSSLLCFNYFLEMNNCKQTLKEYNKIVQFLCCSDSDLRIPSIIFIAWQLFLF